MPEPDVSPTDLAEQVISLLPKANKVRWGKQMDELINAHDSAFLRQWRQEKLQSALGQHVASVYARRNRQDAPKVTHDGRPMTPTISIRGQISLWLEVSPADWVAAVLHEQAVVEGRFDSNAVRLKVAEVIADRPDLMAMATLAEVLDSLGIDATDLRLEDMGS